MNDVVPITISNPGNNLTYRVIVQLDVNGYTWEVQSTPGVPVDTGSGPYGRTTGQFQTQALMYTQYLMQHVRMELTVSQGGNAYSMSPLVSFVNPNGKLPFSAVG
jgi:hypothetical protein